MDKRREMIDGVQKSRWYIQPKKAMELQAKKLPVRKDNMDQLALDDEF